MEEIILYRVMSGVAHALVWPPALNAISKDPDNRVKHTAMFTMFFVVGYMVGPLIGSVILDGTGMDYHALFVITSYVMGAGVVSILLNYQVRRTATGQGTHLDIRLFREILRLPALLVTLLYSTITFGLVFALYPVSMHERGLDGTTIMHMYAVFGVTRIAAFLLAKRLAAHKGGTIILSTACVAAAMGLSAVGTTPMEFAAAMLLLGFGFASIYPLALDIILANAMKIASERLVGAYEAIFGLGWMLGPLATGYIGHTWGAATLYWVLFATGLGVLLLAFLFRNKMHVTIRVLKHDSTSKKWRIISTKQQLKNDFNTILAGIGVMDMELRKIGPDDQMPSTILRVQDTVVRTITHANEELDGAADLLNTTLAKNIRDLLSGIVETDPAGGAGTGYPGYADIKERVTYCSYRLDTVIGDDAVLK